MSKADWIFGDKEVSRRLRALPDGIRSRVTDSIGRMVLRLQKKIVAEKLSGQAVVPAYTKNGKVHTTKSNKSLQVLNVRTGTLRRSIDQRMVLTSNTIAGVVSTNVSYGKAHEYGGLQTQTIREHMRLVKQAFGRPLKSSVWATVKGHSRTVDLPERSFLRSALAEMQEEIAEDVEKAVSGAVNGR